VSNEIPAENLSLVCQFGRCEATECPDPGECQCICHPMTRLRHELEDWPAPAEPKNPNTPATITEAQHAQIAALLLDAFPVGRWDGMALLVSDLLAIPFGPDQSLHSLSYRQAGDLLEKLTGRRAVPGVSATAVSGPRHARPRPLGGPGRHRR
jgi:hypothetical protein